MGDEREASKKKEIELMGFNRKVANEKFSSLVSLAESGRKVAHETRSTCLLITIRAGILIDTRTL